MCIVFDAGLSLLSLSDSSLFCTSIGFCLVCFVFFFFFQAEDGIRDLIVTGVQTCALPICRGGRRPISLRRPRACARSGPRAAPSRPPDGGQDAGWLGRRRTRPTCSRRRDRKRGV